jgi:hypothetical protein
MCHCYGLLRQSQVQGVALNVLKMMGVQRFVCGTVRTIVRAVKAVVCTIEQTREFHVGAYH